VVVSRQEQYKNEVLITKLGMRIREIRVSKKLSQEELGNLCNLEISQINRIELGKINTSISHLYLIADKLGITLSELFKFEV
jgi:transcriptional regulator with XRE-family HTH domain